MKKKVAIFSTGWGTEILYKYTKGIIDGFANEQVDVYLFLSNAALDDTESYMQGELNIFNLPDLHDFDAALFFANGLDFPDLLEMLSKRCKEANIPAIITGRKFDGCYFVGADNYTGTKELCDHLIKEHGVESAWFIAGNKDNMDSQTRLKAVRESLQENGFELRDEDVAYTDWIPVNAVEFLLRRLGNGDEFPDAIICANDFLAMAAVAELEKRGINTPEDVIITGFDNEYAAQVFWPSISSVNQRFDLIGKACAQVLLKLFQGQECPLETWVPCEAAPGESCGCHNAKDFSAMRKELGRKRYRDQIAATYFDWNLSAFEHSVMYAVNFEELSERFKKVYANENAFEGDAFHILVDPLFEASVYEENQTLRKEGYSGHMDVLFSVEHGNRMSFSGFDTKKLVPQMNEEVNNFHLFMPLQEEGFCLGYMIFCNEPEKLLEMNYLRRYVERVDMVLGKYIRDRRVEVLHKRLLDMTKTDGLTKVKNRLAYEERAEILQNKINIGEDHKFGIAIFDINNLKMFNDQLGHEAGDAYIMASCKLICNVFKRSAVYRIGGDEFVAVLEGADYEERLQLVEDFNQEMVRLRGEDLLPQDKVSVAVGLATYKPEMDVLVTDIFKRADGRMYENKITMKSQGW